MAYKVLDIYRDLPRTNCGDCGKGGCFPFASSVYLEGTPLALCPHLSEEHRDAMASRLAQGRQQGEGKKPPSVEQALAHLRATMVGLDLVVAGRKAGGRYEAGEEEAVVFPFIGRPHRVTRSDVVALEGPQPTIWVKILLLIYLTRATGRIPTSDWAAYRELPSTVSKSKSFEGCADKVADRFGGDLGSLDRAAERIGGRSESFGSADRVLRFPVLPRVDLLLLFWDREEEFPARASILVDRGVLDYLDQEALVFLAEAFSHLLCGGRLEEVTG